MVWDIKSTCIIKLYIVDQSHEAGSQSAKVVPDKYVTSKMSPGQSGTDNNIKYTDCAVLCL